MPKKSHCKKEPKRDYCVIFTTADGITSKDWITVRYLPERIWREIGGQSRVYTSRKKPAKDEPKPAALRPYKLVSAARVPVYHEDFTMPHCVPPSCT